MFEGLISSVLNRVLGGFIQDLDANQLNISLWSGTVKLENLQIKPTLFDTMPVPFQLAFGKVGLIYLEIPYTSIFSSPLVIEISDVNLLVRPKDYADWKEEIEVEAFRNATLAALQKFDAYLLEKE